jgi:hypothetical protein
MNRLFHISGIAGAAAILAVASSSLANAEVYVIESTAAQIKTGARLGDNDRISIPAGTYIRAVLPTGKTQTIRGPYQGSLDEFSKGQAPNEGLLAWLRALMQSGGSREQTTGAVRSAVPKPTHARLKFNWAEIPVPAEGDICIVRDARLVLVRTPSSRAARATIVDMESSQTGQVEWAAGNDTTAWPANLQPRANASYRVITSDRAQRQVTLRVFDSRPADDDVLTALQERGCRVQFETWVREKLVSSN